MWSRWWMTQAKRWMCRLNGAVAVTPFIRPGYKSSALEGNRGSGCCWSQVRLNGKQQVPSNWPWLSRRLHGCFRSELVNKWLGKKMRKKKLKSGTIATFLPVQICITAIYLVMLSHFFDSSFLSKTILVNGCQKFYFMFPFAEILATNK